MGIKMPTYVFECQDCETQFEEFRKISEYDQPASCPNCESDNTKKVITAVGFILKGDGWAGKNHRIEGQMRDKNKRLKKKEDEYLTLFHDMGAKHLMLTRGDKGAIFSTSDGDRREYAAIPVKEMVDPTGAGDAFTAGFFSTYLKTKDFDKAMQVGINVATFSLGHLGACAPLKPVESYY